MTELTTELLKQIRDGVYETNGRIDQTNEHLDRFRTELDAKIDQTRTELTAKLDQTLGLSDDVADLRRRVERLEQADPRR